MRRTAPVVLIVTLAIAGCTSDAGKRSAPTLTAPTSSTGPLLGTFGIGNRATLPGGDTVQVYGYSADITPSNEFSRPRPGSVFSVIDVEGCAGQSPTPGALLNPFFFHLELPDGSTVPAGIPVKDPALSVARLIPGACSRGFVTFEVPTGVAPVTWSTPCLRRPSGGGCRRGKQQPAGDLQEM